MSSPQVQWDAPKATNPPPQVKWDAPAQSSSEPKASLLSNIGLTEGPDVRITDYPHATLNGIQSIGRGVRGAIGGAYKTLKTAANAWSDPHADVGDTVLPDPHLEQVPGAIHDINQSPDPAGTYAKVGQETAGQGAGQALTALAPEGIARAGPPVIRGVARGTNIALKRAPGMIGSGVGAAIGHEVGAPGIGAAIGYGVGREVLPRLRVPGEDFGIPKPVYPGATLPAKPAPELLQGNALTRGPGRIEDPAAGLGKISSAPRTPIARPLTSGDPILDQLRAIAANIEREGHGDEIPGEEEATPETSNLNGDLTPALKKSLAKVRAAKRVQLAKPKSSSASTIQ